MSSAEASQHPTRSAQLEVSLRWGGAPLLPSARSKVSLTVGTTQCTVEVEAPAHGDPPPPGPPGHRYGLWSYEVVELFIASDENPNRYLELELGPHQHFLILAFSSVRSPDAIQRSAAAHPALSYQASPLPMERWRARLTFPTSWLPPGPRWRACAFAIHGRGEQRAYEVSAPLQGDLPDFHQPELFPLLSWSHPTHRI